MSKENTFEKKMVIERKSVNWGNDLSGMDIAKALHYIGNLRITYGNDVKLVSGNYTHYLDVSRIETDKEYDDRLKRIKRAEEILSRTRATRLANKKRALALEEIAEKKLFLKLKEKYENSETS